MKGKRQEAAKEQAKEEEEEGTRKCKRAPRGMELLRAEATRLLYVKRNVPTYVAYVAILNVIQYALYRQHVSTHVSD